MLYLILPRRLDSNIHVVSVLFQVARVSHLMLLPEGSVSSFFVPLS